MNPANNITSDSQPTARNSTALRNDLDPNTHDANAQVVRSRLLKMIMENEQKRHSEANRRSKVN